jgi:hypothetical protein
MWEHVALYASVLKGTERSQLPKVEATAVHALTSLS